MKRLTVLLGAGSTLRASIIPRSGTPSTEELTYIVSRDIDLAKKIYDELQSKYKSVNFEDILFALENLEAYLFSKYIKGHLRSAQFDPVISAFTEIRGDLGLSLDHQRVSKSRKMAIKFIFAKLVYSLENLRERPQDLFLKDLIEKLHQYFSLHSFTLNYDDLIDLASDNWFDGFLKKEGTSFSKFDGPEFLRRFDNEKNTLVHLHGCIRFGFKVPPRGTQINPGSIVKYQNPMEALDSYARTIPGEIHVDGQILSQDPIISGLNKLDKLSLNPSPFGYYYQAFIRTMIEVPNLLIIGYGARDPHINEWIREFARVHGTNRKIVMVSLFEKDDIGKDLPIVDFARKVMGTENFQYHEMVRDVPNTWLEMGPCFRWVQSGFPFENPEILDKIIEYFEH
ncbi:SIR2 family protein [Leptospirillum ferriphilum]|uniref:SIR2 family protein n=1 Tax=Leptospirillum ferriphilum TaxID=178606 RepID=UPI0006B175F8|nr:SIR2 family protein [Leptospirillum ferriphilum]